MCSCYFETPLQQAPMGRPPGSRKELRDKTTHHENWGAQLRPRPGCALYLVAKSMVPCPARSSARLPLAPHQRRRPIVARCSWSHPLHSRAFGMRHPWFRSTGVSSCALIRWCPSESHKRSIEYSRDSRRYSPGRRAALPGKFVRIQRQYEQFRA